MRENKKILLFTDWYEPGYKAGGTIQSCKNLVNLLKEDFRFFIICSDRDLGDDGAYEGIFADVWTSRNGTVRIFYASPSFQTLARLRNLIREVNPDKVYFNSMYSRKFTLYPFWILMREHFGGRIILAPRGMLHKGALLRKYLKKIIFLKAVRYSGFSKKLTFHATDDQEKKDIVHYFTPKAKVIVARDTPGAFQKEWEEKEKRTGQLDCIFISRVHPKKNLHYILERFRELNGRMSLNFDIYGAEDDPHYSKFCKEIAEKFGENIRIRFKGPLPHNKVMESLKSYHLFVLPTLGENFGHAIFEALSAGRPVLISDQTPWKRLEQHQAGWDLPLDRPELFKNALEKMASFDQKEYNEWSHHAWSFAFEYSRDSNLANEYMHLFH